MKSYSTDSTIDNGAALDLGKKKYGTVQNADFDESKHPRADDGKFGSGGGGASGDGDKGSAKAKSTPKKTVKKDDWFDAVKSTTGHWDRKGPNELVLWFSGYKTAEAYEAETKLMAMGGRVMSMDFDKHSGKTMVTVREPGFEGEEKKEKAPKEKAPKEKAPKEKKAAAPAMKKSEWFGAVKAVTGHWDRKGPNELVLFVADKSAVKAAKTKIEAAGGKVTGSESVAGKTALIVKEPKLKDD